MGVKAGTSTLSIASGSVGWVNKKGCRFVTRILPDDFKTVAFYESDLFADILNVSDPLGQRLRVLAGLDAFTVFIVLWLGEERIIGSQVFACCPSFQLVLRDGTPPERFGVRAVNGRTVLSVCRAPEARQ